MYKPQQPSQGTTVAGLVFEGLGLMGIIIGLVVLIVFVTQGRSIFLDQDLTEGQVDMIFLVLHVIIGVLAVLAFVVTGFFVVNLYLFTRLLRGGFTPEQARSVHLYQAIWGGVNLLFNQIAGVLYLVSGLSALFDDHSPLNPS